MQLMAAAVLTGNGNGLIFHLFQIADIPRFSLDKQSVLYFSAAENNRLALLFARKLSHKKLNTNMVSGDSLFIHYIELYFRLLDFTIIQKNRPLLRSVFVFSYLGVLSIFIIFGRRQ